MADKKIQARNKFVGKISNKIDKLNQDIKLLLEVDKALNVQVGGGVLEEFSKVVNQSTNQKTIQKLNDSDLVAKVNDLTTTLQKKITILENTLGILLSHLSKSEPYDISNIKIPVNGLDSISEEINKLDSTLDANKFEEFNRIYLKYTSNDDPFTDEMYKKDFVQTNTLPSQVKDLLHKTITLERNTKNFKNKVPDSYE